MDKVPVSSVVVDGATWIWNGTVEVSPDRAQIVDFYHAAQHLSQAAEALFPADPARSTAWAEQMRQHLKLGHVWRIIHALNAAQRPELAHCWRIEFKQRGRQNESDGSWRVG